MVEWLESKHSRGPLANSFALAPPPPKAKASRARPKLVLSPFQPVERDFAFLVDAAVEADKIVRAARNSDKAMMAMKRAVSIAKYSARVHSTSVAVTAGAHSVVKRCG